MTGPCELCPRLRLGGLRPHCTIDADGLFRTQATRAWFKVLRRRSQRHRLNWGRMDRLL